MYYHIGMHDFISMTIYLGDKYYYHVPTLYISHEFFVMKRQTHRNSCGFNSLSWPGVKKLKAFALDTSQISVSIRDSPTAIWLFWEGGIWVDVLPRAQQGQWCWRFLCTWRSLAHHLGRHASSSCQRSYFQSAGHCKLSKCLKMLYKNKAETFRASLRICGHCAVHWGRDGLTGHFGTAPCKRAVTPVPPPTVFNNPQSQAFTWQPPKLLHKPRSLCLVRHQPCSASSSCSVQGPGGPGIPCPGFSYVSNGILLQSLLARTSCSFSIVKQMVYRLSPMILSREWCRACSTGLGGAAISERSCTTDKEVIVGEI